MSRMRDALDKLSQQSTAAESASDGVPNLSFPPADGVETSPEFAEFARQLTMPEAAPDLPSSVAPSGAEKRPLFPFKSVTAPPVPDEEPPPPPTDATSFSFERQSAFEPIAADLVAPAPPMADEQPCVAEPEHPIEAAPPLDLRAHGLAGRLSKGRAKQVVEAASALRRSLASQRAQVVLVCGAGPAQVIADLALRLSVEMANQASGSATLLVDADFRDRWLTMRLGMTKAPGWTDAVFEWLPWNGVFRPTTTAGLVICPLGTQLKISDGLAQSGNDAVMPWMELGAKDNCVVVYAGGLPNAVLANLAKTCDAACLVADIGQASKEVIESAHVALGTTGLPVLGCLAVG